MIHMSCKYPKESRMHYSCILCSDKNICKNTINTLPTTSSNIPMPEVKPPKCDIPSAYEANQQTKSNIENYWEKQLSDIGEKIANAIKECKFCIVVHGCLKPETKQELEKLGYNVKPIGSQYNEPYYRISWK